MLREFYKNGSGSRLHFGYNLNLLDAVESKTADTALAVFAYANMSILLTATSFVFTET